MTGYQSKRAMAQDKLEQWDTPSEAFNEWWNGEYDDSTNPYEKDTFAYWAWAAWQEALAQPAQEPWRESASDYERGVIDGMQKQAQSSVDKAVNRMAQRTEERNFCPRCGKRTPDLETIHTCTPPQEKNK